MYRTVVTVLGSGNSKINEKCHLSLIMAPSGVEGTAHARALVVELSGVEQECRPRLNPHNAKREQKKVLSLLGKTIVWVKAVL